MRQTIWDRRQRQSGTAVRIGSLVRRLVVKAATAVNRWQLAGHVDDEGNEEPFESVPVYQQVGFVSRPKAGTGKTKAILVAAGGSARAVAVIASDDPTGKPALDHDETAIFNSLVRVICTDDGTVLIDNGSGAVPLALKSDVEALRTAFNAHTHVASVPITGPAGTTAVAMVAPSAAPAVVGTSVLKGK
jgi:phage gp45-like